MAANTGFLNDNLYRAYPLQHSPALMTQVADDLDETEVELPTNVIVDFGSLLGAAIEYDPAEHVVYLESITRPSGPLIFTFRCTATDDEDYELVFHRAVTASEFTTDNVECSPPHTPSCSDDDGGGFWDGFLVTGQLAELLVLVPVGYSLQGSPETTAVEPGVILSCRQRFVRSVNLANATRVMDENPVGCDGPAVEAQTIKQVGLCLTGPLRLKAGFNTNLSQDGSDNSFTIGAAIGAGAGEPCDVSGDIPYYPEEERPAGSGFYSGGPACSELINTINGVAGPDIALRAGPGITISRADGNVLNVAIDLHDLQICEAE